MSYLGHDILYWERTLDKKVSEQQLEKATWNLYKNRLELSGGEYLASVEYMQLYTRKVAAWYETGGWDLLLTPTMQKPLVEVGTFEIKSGEPQRSAFQAGGAA